MKRIIGFCCGVALACGLAVTMPATASAQDVKTEWDRDANFAQYKTFAVEIGTRWGNPFSEKVALQAVQKALTSKGWTETPAASADTRVIIHGATRMKRDLTTFYSGYGGYRYGGMGSATTTVYEYKVGTMVVDVFDARTKALIWRGIGEDEASDKPEKNYKKIEKGTQKMFKEFPPKPDKR